jgi:superfamily II DNA/RNA helicase
VNQKKLVLEGIFCLDFVICGGKAPWLFQLQAMLAVLEKRDLVAKAGTGYRKTLCMVLPLLVRRDGIAIMVTPLKLLQKKHVRHPPMACILTDISKGC